MDDADDDALRSGEIVATATARCLPCFSLVVGESCFWLDFLPSTSLSSSMTVSSSWGPSPRCVMPLPLPEPVPIIIASDFGLALASSRLSCIGMVLEGAAAAAA